jgi:hypothetical protein
MSNISLIKSILGKKESAFSKREQLLKELFKVPAVERGKQKSKFDRPEKEGVALQGDLLFLPTDQFGYKYLLVVVDLAFNRVDAEPLKNKSSDDVLSAFKRIFARGILKIPIYIYFDAGGEFEGSVRRYFDDLKVIQKTAATQRHSQQSVVEYFNKQIGTIIGQLQTIKEIETKKESKGWVVHIKDILSVLNEKADANQRASNKEHRKNVEENGIRGERNISKAINQIVDGIAENNGKSIPTIKKETPIVPQAGILKEGDRVRYALDFPIGAVSDNKLHGKFRATDFRFSKSIHEIVRAIIVPNAPIRYLISDITDRSFSTNQLQLTAF